jgi:flagellar biosynthesis/type III secretory pathway protein FliH
LTFTFFVVLDMVKRKTTKKPTIPRLASVEEAMEAVSEYLNVERYRDDPYAEEVTPEQLRSLIERIWHDAYNEGRASGYEEGRSESGE